MEASVNRIDLEARVAIVTGAARGIGRPSPSGFRRRVRASQSGISIAMPRRKRR
jgi:hypothetical protein